MRLHRSVPVLAAALALAGVSAPVASAHDAMAPSGGIGQPTTVVQHHSTGSTDWIIGIGTATGIAVVGTGTAAGLRHRRRAAVGDTRTVNG